MHVFLGIFYKYQRAYCV